MSHVSRSSPPDDSRPFEGHTDSINAIGYSPDGQYLVTGSSDGTVCFWDPHTGTQRHQYMAAYPVLSLSFSLSGRQLAGISAQENLRVARVFVLDLSNDTAHGMKAEVDILYESDNTQVERSHMVTFSADERLVAVMLPTRIILQHARTGDEIMDVVRMEGNSRLESLLAFISDDNRLLYAYRDDLSDRNAPLKVHVFDLYTETGMELRLSLNPSLCLMPPIVCFPLANTIAGTLSQGGFQIWDIDRGEILHDPLLGHLDSTTSICFSLDGKWIIDGSEAKTVCVWDTSTGKRLLGPLRHPSQHSLKVIACSPLKDYIACVDVLDGVHLWNIASEKLVLSSVPKANDNPPLTMTGITESLHWLPDGSRFISSGPGDDHICTWDASTGKQVGKFLFHGGSRIGLSPNGELLAVGSTRMLGTVTLLDASTGEEHSPSLMEPGSATRKLEFSPDSSTLAILLSKSDTLRIMRDVLGKRKLDTARSSSEIVDVVFSPDGDQFAYATLSEGGVHICDSHTLQVTFRVAAKEALHNRFLSFSPDGVRLLESCNETGVTLWNLTTRERLLGIPGGRGYKRQAAFSPDGRSVVRNWSVNARDAGVEMFDATNGKRSWRTQEKQLVTALSIAPGGERIVVGFIGGMLKVYDAGTGEALLPKSNQDSSEEVSNERQARRVVGADFDDDSIMNMPATLSRPSRGRSESDRRGMHQQALNKGKGKQKVDNEEVKSGIVARFTSRFSRGASKPREPNEARRRWHRAIELVSVGRATNRVVAAGDRDIAQRRTRRELDSDVSSGPSPPPSAHASAPRAGSSTSRSSDDLMDTVRFCLCFPRCR